MTYDTINTTPRLRGDKRHRFGAQLRRRAATALLGAALLAALAPGCTRDITETDPPGQGGKPGTGGYATLQLVVPGSAAPGTYAAEAADETALDTDNGLLHALIYVRNGEGNWQFSRVAQPEIAGTGAVQDDGYRTYDIRIPFGEGDYDASFRVGLVAGVTLDELKAAGGYIADGEQWPDFAPFRGDDDPQDESPMARARSVIPFTTGGGKWPVPPTGAFRPFPMWGESAEFRMRPQGTVAGTVRLLRATARIDVGVDFRKEGGKFPLNDMKAQGLLHKNGKYFQLTSVSVYRTATAGTCGAGPGLLDATTGRVTGPYEVAGRRLTDDKPLTYKEGELTQYVPAQDENLSQAELENRICLTRQCYIPEMENTGAEFDDAVCIVVGGKYGSDAATITYYRIDIATPRFDAGGQLKPTPDDRLDILRNTVYVVNITDVAGVGEKTEEDALHNDNTKLSAEVVPWDQNDQVGDIVTDGVYMLSVDKSEVQYYADGTAETFTVKTDYDGELGKGWTLTVEGSDDFKGGLRYYDAQGKAYKIADQGFPKTGLPGTMQLRFGMEEYENAPDGTVRAREGKLIFSAGRMKTQVVLNQTSRELLRLLFNPEELYFGPEGPEKTVTITVTTKKGYKLTIASEGKEITLWPQSPTGKHSDFKNFFSYFQAEPGGRGHEYKVWPAKLNETEDDRAWSFELTAERVDGQGNPVDPNNPQMKVTETFDIYQLKEPVEWKVVDAPNGELHENPWEVVVANNATTATANVETNPGTLLWWFSNGGSSTGDDSWLTNLATFIGTRQTGGRSYVFNMQANPGISRRSMTLPVNTITPGLDPSTKLVVTQKGAPLTLEPSTQETNVVKETQAPANGNPGIYILDHGTGYDGATYTLEMTSNTNWYWYWNKDDQTVFDTNKELLIGRDESGWQPTKPQYADNKATTDHPYPGDDDYTWDEDKGGVAKLTIPTVQGAEDPADDPETEQPDMPLGGTRTIVRELRNSDPRLTPDDVRDYARQLHISRTLPAYTHIAQWPFADMSSLDLAEAEGKYAGAEFIALSNAPGKLTLTSGDNENSQPLRVAEVDLIPTKGYQQMEQIFSKIPRMPYPTEATRTAPATFYRLTYDYEKMENGNVVKGSDYNIYYTGYELKVPKRNMAKGQYYLNSGEHKLKLDFSNSCFMDMFVRVKAVLANTDEDTSDAGVLEYVNHDPANPIPATGENGRVRYLFPTQDDANAARYMRSDDANSMLITIDLPANVHTNMLYRVVVETSPARDATTPTGEWTAMEDLKIFQDGNPATGSTVIWKYSPGTWRASVSSGSGTNLNLNQPPNTEPGNLIAGTGLYWQEPSPFITGITNAHLPAFKTSFDNAKNLGSVNSTVSAPASKWNKTLAVKSTQTVAGNMVVGGFDKTRYFYARSNKAILDFSVTIPIETESITFSLKANSIAGANPNTGLGRLTSNTRQWRRNFQVMCEGVSILSAPDYTFQTLDREPGGWNSYWRVINSNSDANTTGTDAGYLRQGNDGWMSMPYIQKGATHSVNINALIGNGQAKLTIPNQACNALYRDTYDDGTAKDDDMSEQ